MKKFYCWCTGYNSHSKFNFVVKKVGMCTVSFLCRYHFKLVIKGYLGLSKDFVFGIKRLKLMFYVFDGSKPEKVGLT